MTPAPDDGLDWKYRHPHGAVVPCAILSTPDSYNDVAISYVDENLRRRVNAVPAVDLVAPLGELEEILVDALHEINWISPGPLNVDGLVGVTKLADALRKAYPNLILARTYGTVTTSTPDVITVCIDPLGRQIPTRATVAVTVLSEEDS